MVDILYDRRVDKTGDFYFMFNKAKNETKVSLHVHNSCELKFIVDGNYLAMVEDEKIPCKKGDVLFVNSRTPHAYMSVGESTNYVLVFDSEIFKIVFPQGKTLPKHVSLNEKFGTVKAALDEARADWENLDYNQKKGFVIKILGTLLQYVGAVNEKQCEENLVSNIIEYIREHCHEEITLESLAKTFGYSKNYFSNFFNKRFYMNLRECVNRFRVERAMRLIEKNGKSLSLCAVAERCGYNSMNTFYRAFKRYAAEINIKDS